MTSSRNSQAAALRSASFGSRFLPADDDHFARFQMQLIGAAAELERNIIRERQAEGIAIAKAKGVYRRTPKLTTAAVAAARDRIEQQVPVAVIAREQGVSRQTLSTAIRREQRSPRP